VIVRRLMPVLCLMLAASSAAAEGLVLPAGALRSDWAPLLGAAGFESAERGPVVLRTDGGFVVLEVTRADGTRTRRFDFPATEGARAEIVAVARSLVAAPAVSLAWTLPPAPERPTPAIPAKARPAPEPDSASIDTPPEPELEFAPAVLTVLPPAAPPPVEPAVAEPPVITEEPRRPAPIGPIARGFARGSVLAEFRSDTDPTLALQADGGVALRRGLRASVAGLLSLPAALRGFGEGNRTFSLDLLAALRWAPERGGPLLGGSVGLAARGFAADAHMDVVPVGVVLGEVGASVPLPRGGRIEPALSLRADLRRIDAAAAGYEDAALSAFAVRAGVSFVGFPEGGPRAAPVADAADGRRTVIDSVASGHESVE
jgi:hypothetical protein